MGILSDAYESERRGQRYERELARDVDAMRGVVEAAVAWWRGLVGWSDAEHVHNPVMNLTGGEKRLHALARAVADYVAARAWEEHER